MRTHRSIRLDAELDEALRILAAEHDRPISWLIERAIRQTYIASPTLALVTSDGRESGNTKAARAEGWARWHLLPGTDDYEQRKHALPN